MPLQPSPRTFDAGQAYEVISVPYLLSVLGRILRYTTSRHLPTFYGTTNTQPPRTFHQPTGAPMQGVKTFSLEQLLHGAKCLLLLRIYRLGHLYAVQRKGVPIGGPLSAAFLFCALAPLEHAFRTSGWQKWFSAHPNHKREFLLYRFEALFGLYRYEDDIAVDSKCFCDSCKDSLPETIYGNHIHFDSNLETRVIHGTLHTKFLDFWLAYHRELPGPATNITSHTLLPWSVDFIFYNPNELFIATANVAHRKKSRYKSSPGCVSKRESMIMVSVLKGRFARWEQLLLSDASIRLAVSLVIWELFVEGYTPSHIRTFFHKLGPSVPQFLYAIDVIGYLISNFGSNSRCTAAASEALATTSDILRFRQFLANLQ